jgi:phosphate transport system substrate-binding protein
MSPARSIQFNPLSSMMRIAPLLPPTAWLLVAMMAATAYSQGVGTDSKAPDSSEAVRDPIAVQAARTVHVTTRGKKVFYTQKWDLNDLPHYVPQGHVSGKITMWGLNYLGDSNLGKYWEDAFHTYQPDVSFDYHLVSAWDAIAGLITGVADLAPCRAIQFNELIGFERAFNHDPLAITLATGSFDVPGWMNAIGFFVNKANPTSRLTFRQLDGIFGSERSGGWVGTEWHPEFARGPEGNIRTWGQLGLTGEWVDKPIHVYGLTLKYDTAAFLSSVILKGSDKWNEHLRMYANYARKDGTLAIGAEALMKDVSLDPYAICYSGIQNLTPQTKALEIARDENGPYVAMTIENVRARRWPIPNDNFWYLNRKPGQPVDPKVREYLRYTLSQEGQTEVMRDGKYLPLTAQAVAEQLAKLD